jgi:hypothetical protein
MARDAEPFHARDQQPTSLAHGEPTDAIEPPGQRLTLEQFHHNEERTAVLIDVVDLDDVWMLAAARDLGLANEALDHLPVAAVFRQHPLDRKALIRDAVAHLEDDAHAPVPDGPLDAILTADDIARFW